MPQAAVQNGAALPASFPTHALLRAQFSNHTGFPTWTGEIMDGEQLWRLVEGLEANGLCGRYTHLLTGGLAGGAQRPGLAGRWAHCAAVAAGPAARHTIARARPTAQHLHSRRGCILVCRSA